MLLTASMGIGVLVYLVLWLALPLAAEEAAGVRPGRRRCVAAHQVLARVPADLGVMSAALLAGLLWLVQSAGRRLPQGVLWPGLAGTVGLMLIWWQADHISNRSIRRQTGARQWFAPLIAHWSRIVRILLGLAGLGTGIALVAVQLPAMSETARTLLVLGLVVVTLLLAAAPWFIRVRRSLTAAREEKMLADARADMAAHLHDSVLQTLALIQRQASDPEGGDVPGAAAGTRAADLAVRVRPLDAASVKAAFGSTPPPR